MAKNFSMRLLLPMDLHQSYMQVVNDKAKKNAFVTRLREDFAKLLAEAVMSKGKVRGNITDTIGVLNGNNPSSIASLNGNSLNKDSFTNDTQTQKGRAEGLIIPKESIMQVPNGTNSGESNVGSE